MFTRKYTSYKFEIQISKISRSLKAKSRNLDIEISWNLEMPIVGTCVMCYIMDDADLLIVIADIADPDVRTLLGILV